MSTPDLFENAQNATDSAEELLRAVASHFTRDDDLPDDLLPRIDAWLEAFDSYARITELELQLESVGAGGVSALIPKLTGK